MAHFTDAGRAVVALDLRGHGRSDKPDGAYDMSVFADDVAWLCGELDLTKPVLIGHSMGGIIAFDLAARYPDLVGAIVMLDAAIVLPKAARRAIPSFLAQLAGPDHRSALRNYVSSSLFLPTDDGARKAWILDGMAAAPQHVMVAAFQGLGDYDPGVGRNRIAVPALYIAADEPAARSDMDRLGSLIPSLQLGKTVGSGHFCQLEVPEQVNAMIDRFLTLNT